jgi:Cof subfamily protein (haloacid dehalogenase superfamily)
VDDAARLNRPRVIATDLDGTLLRSDGTLSARSRAALAAAEDAGLQVVFVTARPPRWLTPLVDAVAGHGTVIAGNGAFVVEASSGRVLRTRGFSRAQVMDIVTDLRGAAPRAGFSVERASGPLQDERFHAASDEGLDERYRVEALEQIDDEPTGKLLALDVAARTAASSGRFLRIVEEVVGARGHLAYSGMEGLAEISPPGVTKASGLERWCAAAGIASSEVWAFGDMPNDLPMLGWAGRSFAVANAHPAGGGGGGRRRARPADNDEDGVASVLEALVG